VILVDRDALSRCHDRPCEWCGRGWRARHAHHVFGRGLGGSHRVDADWTLCTLCWVCHSDTENGKRPFFEDVLAKVAAREDMLQHDLARAWEILAMLSKVPTLDETRQMLRRWVGSSRNTRRLVLTTVRRKRELLRTAK
jgi:hypothetical protein